MHLFRFFSLKTGNGSRLFYANIVIRMLQKARKAVECNEAIKVLFVGEQQQNVWRMVFKFKKVLVFLGGRYA